MKSLSVEEYSAKVLYDLSEEMKECTVFIAEDSAVHQRGYALGLGFASTVIIKHLPKDFQDEIQKVVEQERRKRE